MTRRAAEQEASVRELLRLAAELDDQQIETARKQLERRKPTPLTRLDALDAIIDGLTADRRRLFPPKPLGIRRLDVVREWARSRGYDVADSGPLPQLVLMAFRVEQRALLGD